MGRLEPPPRAQMVSQPMIITVNGEAKAILQDLGEYECHRETTALLKLLAMSRREVEAGRLHDAKPVFAEIGGGKT